MSDLPTVLITGASKGVGRAIAIQLSKSKKYKLALLSRNLTGINETIKVCKSVNSNIKCLPLQCDITDDKKLSQTISLVGNSFGPLCVLINNAGQLYVKSIDDPNINIKKINKLIDINLKGSIKTTIYSVPFIKKSSNLLNYKNNCAIITIGSRASTIRSCGATVSFYNSTKFGQRGFNECLFHDLREFGIKVSIIMPGYTNTNMLDNHRDKDVLDRSKTVQPTDCANAVEFVLNSAQTVCPLEILLAPQRCPVPSKL